MSLEAAGLVCFSSYPTNVVLVYHILLIQGYRLKVMNNYVTPTMWPIIRLSLFVSPPTSFDLSSAWDTKPYGKL